MFIKFLLVCAWAVAAGSEFSPVNLPVKRYCSTALSDALRLTCGGRYPTMAATKGDNFSPLSESLMKSRLVAELLPDRVGLVHECCRRPCGYNELRKYCLT